MLVPTRAASAQRCLDTHFTALRQTLCPMFVRSGPLREPRLGTRERWAPIAAPHALRAGTSPCEISAYIIVGYQPGTPLKGDMQR